jgi:hypothetical protein
LKIGIVAPTKFLSKYCITDIQYCLPKLLQEDKRYRNFYLRRKEKGDLIILDCVKPGWKRQPEYFSLIEEAIRLLGNPLVILPSYMYNLSKTLEVIKESLKRLQPGYIASCLEGASIEEVITCLAKVEKFSNCIAIPSHLYKIYKGEGYKNSIIYIDNHLNLEELDNLDGTLVTSLPVRLGLEGRLLSNHLPSPPSLNFYEDIDEYPMITEKNVKEAIEFYKGE